MSETCEKCGKPMWPCANADHRHGDTPFVQMCHGHATTVASEEPALSDEQIAAKQEARVIAALRAEREEQPEAGAEPGKGVKCRHCGKLKCHGKVTLHGPDFFSCSICDEPPNSGRFATVLCHQLGNCYPQPAAAPPPADEAEPGRGETNQDWCERCEKPKCSLPQYICDTQHMEGRTMGDFEDELRKLINRHCRENASDTPDFILAAYLIECLNAFNAATQSRERWYGRDVVKLQSEVVE